MDAMIANRIRYLIIVGHYKLENSFQLLEDQLRENRQLGNIFEWYSSEIEHRNKLLQFSISRAYMIQAFEKVKTQE